MKQIKGSFLKVQTLITSVLLLFVLGFAGTCSMYAASTDGGILNLQGPPPADYDDPILIHGSQSTGPGGTPALPTTVTNASLGRFTNLNFRVVQDSPVTITLEYRSQITNATASNAVLYVEMSPNGKTWASTSPTTFAHTPTTTNNYIIQWTLSGTNFGANRYGRIMGLTNLGSVANGSVFPSNVWISTWRPRTQNR